MKRILIIAVGIIAFALRAAAQCTPPVQPIIGGKTPVCISYARVYSVTNFDNSLTYARHCDGLGVIGEDQMQSIFFQNLNCYLVLMGETPIDIICTSKYISRSFNLRKKNPSFSWLAYHSFFKRTRV